MDFLLLAGADEIKHLKARQFVLAYVLARQQYGTKRSLTVTDTPADASLCGVFRLYILTALHPVSPVFGTYWPTFSKPPDCGVLVRIFNRPVDAGFRAVDSRFAMASVVGYLPHKPTIGSSSAPLGHNNLGQNSGAAD